MTVETEHRSNVSGAGREDRAVRYLVIGREGVLALGGLLGGLLRLEGLMVDEIVRFDHDRKLSLYEIAIKARRVSEANVEADLIICLNDDALDYEEHVRNGGILLLDASCVKRLPERTDVVTVSVPAFNLVQDIARNMTEETKDRFDPTLSSLLGSFEAMESEYPDPEVLKCVFDNLQIEPAAPFILAVYRGYDWLQETQMRGKTPCGGALG